MQVGPGDVWRATRTPEGPATAHLVHRCGRLEVEAWGAGAPWACEHAGTWAGLDDDAGSFEPGLPFLRDLWRHHRGGRIGRSLAVAEAVAPTVLEQKVVSADARASWRWLVRRLGEPAPGPAGLLLPPAPGTLAATPSWVFHQANVERRRADTVRRAMARAVRLDETVDLPLHAAYARLVAFPGIGPWTAAEVAGVALGDPDAVSVGDYHLKHTVSWALAGEPRGTDERMLELLEPWRGHRARVVRLLGLAVGSAPRRGPRMERQAIAAI